MTSSEEKGIKFLKNLPQDTTIAWNSHHTSGIYFMGGWIDIDCPMLAKEANWNWCWTVEDPRYIGMQLLEGPLDKFDIMCKFDAKLYMHLAPGQIDGKPVKLVLQTFDKKKIDLSWTLDEQEAEFKADGLDDWEEQITWFWQSQQNTQPVTNIIDKTDHNLYEPFAERIESSAGDVVVCPVWTIEGISKALERWAVDNGCKNNLQFVFKKDIPVPPYIQKALDAKQAWENRED